MEFRLFPGEDVPESLRDDLATFSKLTETDRRVVEDYLRGFGPAEDKDERYHEFVHRSGLPPDDFDRITGAIRFVLEAWYRQKLELSDVLEDLTLLGLEGEIKNLLEPLERLEGAGESMVRASEYDLCTAGWTSDCRRH